MAPLIFITLSDEAPTLPEYLGENFRALCERWFSEEYDLSFSYWRPNRSNWKISLEDYHNAAVHSRTYQTWPDAAACTHEWLDDLRSGFKVDAEHEDTFPTRLGKAAYRTNRE